MSAPDFGKEIENGHQDDDAVKVDEDLYPIDEGDDQEERTETAEIDGEEYVPREEHERKISELKERLGKLEEFVGMHIADDIETNCVGASVENISRRVEELERGQDEVDYEPSTKIEKLQKLIHENWSDLSCNGSVQTRTRRNKRGNLMSESINKKADKLMKDVYGDTCQAVQVHEAMERLGSRDEYSFEEKDGYKKLSREEA